MQLCLIITTAHTGSSLLIAIDNLNTLGEIGLFYHSTYSLQNLIIHNEKISLLKRLYKCAKLLSVSVLDLTLLIYSHNYTT